MRFFRVENPRRQELRLLDFCQFVPAVKLYLSSQQLSFDMTLKQRKTDLYWSAFFLIYYNYTTVQGWIHNPVGKIKELQKTTIRSPDSPPVVFFYIPWNIILSPMRFLNDIQGYNTRYLGLPCCLLLCTGGIFLSFGVIHLLYIIQ